MTDHSTRPSGVARLMDQIRRRTGHRRRVVLAVAVSFAMAAALGLILYAASTLTYVASAPMSDPAFGLQNGCALQSIGNRRSGFAVGPKRQVAVFSDQSVAICPPTGEAPRIQALSGTTIAAFDGQGVLWLARRGPAEPSGQLLSWRPGDVQPQRVGEIAPVALAPHARGVLALEASGRLVSVQNDGQVLGVFQLPDPPTAPWHLITNLDGTRAALVIGGGVFIFDTGSLALVRREKPCEVENAFWTEGSGRIALLCGPDSSWGMWLEIQTGQREILKPPLVLNGDTALVPFLEGPVYAQSCDALPCSVPSPLRRE